MERSRQPSVFVAMPFGIKPISKTRDVEDSNQTVDLFGPINVDFDEIWKKLIRPALQSAGCRPYRADDEVTAGDIRTDMLFELVTGEFVLADISTLNANVFYELGVRHGVSPRGVIMIDGGWCKRPFDVAPDRTFTYKGSLFEPTNDRGEAWSEAVKQEVDKLAGRLQGAIANDASTTSSPVYKELSGLIPVNWHQIQNAKARYFGGQFHEWHARVRAAKRQSYVGDILTLSRDAPNRLFEWELRLSAARALLDLGRFVRAEELLRSMVNENPECPETRYALAKTLHRLAGKTKDPKKKRNYGILGESEIEAAIRHGGNAPEAYLLLGRIYKYRWRNCWEHKDDLKERQALALEHWQTAEKALAYYQEAQTRDLSFFHAGINVISLCRLQSHLNLPKQNQYEIDSDLVGLIKTAARNNLKLNHGASAGNKDENSAIWAKAVLGEVALLISELDEAKRFFHRAATDPDVSVTQLVSFGDQLKMYELLGYEMGTVSELGQIIKAQKDQLEFQHKKRVGAQDSGPAAADTRKIITFRGESFEGKQLEQAVSAKIRDLMDEQQIGERDLVVCGARRGAEILFVEECVRRKVDVRVLLPVKKSQFVAEAVRTPKSNWERRFYELAETCEILEQPIRLGPPPTQLDPYERNNDWCLEIARTEFGPDLEPKVLKVIVLSVGSGDLDSINERGSLHHFVECARELDLQVEKFVTPSSGTDPTVSFPVGGTLLRITPPSGKTWMERIDKSLRIGRAEDNDVVLNAPSISRYHLKLELHGNGALLTNLSLHPKATFLNDLELLPDPEKTVLVKYEQTIELIDGTRLKITRGESTKTVPSGP